MDTYINGITENGEFMRYDDMKRLYPDIDQLFAGMSDLIHEYGVDPAMAFGWAQRWISRFVAKEHRQDVADKAQQFIGAIRKSDAVRGVLPCDIQESFMSGQSRS